MPDEPILEQLLATAVGDADPAEVMAPPAGPPGWTPARREAFLAYHRRHRGAVSRLPLVEVTYAVEADLLVVGALRLAGEAGDPAALEVGLWLGRRHRSCGIGRAAVSAAAALATDLGARALVARTTPTNAAALALLFAAGFGVVDRGVLEVRAERVLT